MNGGISMKAYVQVYTGERQGQNDRCYWSSNPCHRRWQESPLLQFMKSKVYSEHTILPTLTNLTLETVGKPFFIIKGRDEEQGRTR